MVITLKYILGLIESDGGILLMFGTGNSKTTLKPLIRITQRSNPNLLPLIYNWFWAHGIPCQVEEWGNRGGGTRPSGKTFTSRAPNVVINTVEGARKFIELVKQENFQFVSQKQRDFFILDRVINSPQTLSLSDKINLKKSLHKDNRFQPDLETKTSIPREQQEKNFGLKPGASNQDSLNILKNIDLAYTKHKAGIEKAIKTKTLLVPPDWFCGLVDGDGSYYIALGLRGPTLRYNKPFIEVQADFTITMETNAILTLKVVQYVAGSVSPIKQSAAHYQLWIRNQEEVINLLAFQDAYPPVGELRRSQYDLAIEVLTKKEQGEMRDPYVLKNIIRKAYSISKKTKGRERPFTCSDMLRKVDEIYGRT